MEMSSGTDVDMVSVAVIDFVVNLGIQKDHACTHYCDFCSVKFQSIYLLLDCFLLPHSSSINCCFSTYLAVSYDTIVSLEWGVDKKSSHN